jgi:cell division protein FtsB
LEKTFVANVTTQVIERHIVRGLEKIFCPLVVSRLSDAEVEGLASEPATIKSERAFLESRIKKLKAGRDTFRGVIAGDVAK